MKIHLDFETFSRADLSNVGAYQYASDPSTRILIAAVALEDQDPFAWVNPEFAEHDPNENSEALWIMGLWDNPEVEVYAHNASFEHALSHFRMLKDVGIRPPKISQFRCSAVMARKASIPHSLAKASEYLNVKNQKSTEGSRLIQLFSVPDKKTGKVTTGFDEPEKFQSFVEYCRQDVRAERDVEEILSPFVMRGAYLQAFHFDLDMNLRGIPVNLKALKNAYQIIQHKSTDLIARFQEITGLRPSQNVKVAEWFKAAKYPGSGMAVDQVEYAVEHLDDWCDDEQVAEALLIRQEIGFAAVNKVVKMIECADDHGLVRGCFFFNGADTGRWSAKLIQPQNFKRPEEHLKKITFEAFRDIEAGATAEEIQLLYGNPLQVISSCIRHFIGFTDGRMVLSADYAAIEARIVCWLAGQEDALDRFRNKEDSYIHMAMKIWPQLLEEEIGKESFERFVGKQAVLGCGYQMGGPKFRDTCIGYGQPISIGLAGIAVDEFRRVYDKVAKLWGLCEKAAKSAIRNPGIEFPAGPKLSFKCVRLSGMKKFLVFSLPSGRKIVYPEPAIDPEGGRWGGEQITFYGQIPFKSTWGRVPTYGGKLVENATQATAFDIMANGAVKAQKKKFNIFALIHDEALAEADPKNPREAEFVEALTDLPAWAEGLPIVAESKLLPFYAK